jgi:hypothetical protein
VPGRGYGSLPSAVRAATVTAVLQTAAENFFIFAFLLLTVKYPACCSGPCSFFKNLIHFKKIYLPLPETDMIFRSASKRVELEQVLIW